MSHQDLNGIWPRHATSLNCLNSRNSFGVFSMIRYIPMPEFPLSMSQSTHAQHFKGEFLSFSMHQLPFGLQAIPVGPAACVVNTSAQLQLGEKGTLDMIVFSSMHGQNCQECVGWKLVVFFFFFLCCIGVSITHVRLSNGSLSLVMSQKTKRAFGWWNQKFMKMGVHIWLSFILTLFIALRIWLPCIIRQTFSNVRSRCMIPWMNSRFSTLTDLLTTMHLKSLHRYIPSSTGSFGGNYSLECLECTNVSTYIYIYASIRHHSMTVGWLNSLSPVERLNAMANHVVAVGLRWQRLTPWQQVQRSSSHSSDEIKGGDD